MWKMVLKHVSGIRDVTELLLILSLTLHHRSLCMALYDMSITGHVAFLSLIPSTLKIPPLSC